MIAPPIFDVSGSHGSPGTSGESLGDSTANMGQHGVRGGRGTIGQRGVNAGTISMQLSTCMSTAEIPPNLVLPDPIDADVKVDASFVSPDGRLQKMDTVMKVNSGELIRLLALGGSGGNGGHGGHGQHGGKGFRYGVSLLCSLQ